MCKVVWLHCKRKWNNHLLNVQRTQNKRVPVTLQKQSSHGDRNKIWTTRRERGCGTLCYAVLCCSRLWLQNQVKWSTNCFSWPYLTTPCFQNKTWMNWANLSRSAVRVQSTVGRLCCVWIPRDITHNGWVGLKIQWAEGMWMNHTLLSERVQGLMYISALIVIH